MAKVLLVEDNKDLANIYKSELEFNGFEILVVAGAVELFQSLPEFIPNIILLDIMLPDGYGIDILKKLKGDDKWKDIKVIMLSNIDAPAVINEAFSCGTDGYLIKSIILPSQLTDEIKNFLK